MLVTAILNFICFILSESFVMAYDKILNLNQIYNEPGLEVIKLIYAQLS